MVNIHFMTKFGYYWFDNRKCDVRRRRGLKEEKRERQKFEEKMGKDGREVKQR